MYLYRGTHVACTYLIYIYIHIVYVSVYMYMYMYMCMRMCICTCVHLGSCTSWDIPKPDCQATVADHHSFLALAVFETGWELTEISKFGDGSTPNSNRLGRTAG